MEICFTDYLSSETIWNNKASYGVLVVIGTCLLCDEKANKEDEERFILSALIRPGVVKSMIHINLPTQILTPDVEMKTSYIPVDLQAR